ncbi:MAG: DUF3048 domain-containing protein [Anaerolineae bacterium]|nr:DUF3048 domain-containing protein [Anaerolineae bacterium]
MIKKVSFLINIAFFLAFLSGCAAGAPVQQTPGQLLASPTETELPRPAVETTSQLTVAAAAPVLLEVNPLTGLSVEDPSQLNRRPILVKIQNAPREDRPPFGLSVADLVFEYSIEFGDTRFAAIFYSRFPDKVGPIRSARHVDIHLVRAYQSVLVFGGAYEELLNLLVDSDFGGRLVREGPNTAPALFRYDPEGKNYLLADLTLMDPILEKYAIDNRPQNLAGMVFSDTIPEGGELAEQINIRFSGASYNRWQYDFSSSRYFRSSESENDINDDKPQYVPLLDRNTGEQIAADNVVILLAVYYPLIKNSSSEVYDIQLVGSGPAYLARDGRMYRLHWQRKDEDAVVSLIDDQGNLFPLKAGQTWFEILSPASRIEQQGGFWVVKNWLP